MENTAANNDSSIDISEIPSGVYYLLLKSGELKSYSQKIIIK
ncbi:MAG: T9SS type A sorting domain-containing protein [Chryseobacterium sp.]|nr:T9SS type A sorting domain-containing protein [Chryseobacterium sp.]